jgi:PUA domain protein
VSGDKGRRLFKRRVLGREDIESLKEEAGRLLSDEVSNAVSRAETEDGATVFFFIRDALLARDNGILFPTLVNPILDELPSIIVDMGAIPFVCNGADIMSPGIVRIEGEFGDDELVVVRDIEHGKALAVGKAMYSSEVVRDMDRGKAISNLHYVGDKIWDAIA